MQPLKTAIEVLQDKWWIGVIAFIASLIATPVVRLIAYRTKIVDRPDDLLKPHGRPIAYLGGVAILVGLLCGLAGCAVTLPDLSGRWHGMERDLVTGRVGSLLERPLYNLIAIGAACIVITAVGLLDDIYNLRPLRKIYGQVLAAGILLVGGVGYRMTEALFGTFDINFPLWLTILTSSVVCCVIVILTCNATNLLDGLDGLCGGVTGIIALSFLALAVWLAMWQKLPGAGELRVGLCLAMAGAVLGFLPYNVPPASIFMGDAGSMLLGFFVATMMSLFCVEGSARWFVAAWVVFAIPALDTGLAVVRRLLAGHNIFAGDRSHLYDQLVDRGMTVKQVVGLFYLLSAVAGVVAVAVAILVRGRYAVPVYFLVFALVWVVFHVKGMLRPPPRKAAGSRGEDESPASSARGVPRNE
jgi:UDP-GlcNAc:undecaprenyl-phosphate GlcNAc-1-phosphate transferase